MHLAILAFGPAYQQLASDTNGAVTSDHDTDEHGGNKVAQAGATEEQQSHEGEQHRKNGIN